jgi:hypothetical protein
LSTKSDTIQKANMLLRSEKYSTIGKAMVYSVDAVEGEPIEKIKIDGVISVKALPVLYKLLTGKKI